MYIQQKINLLVTVLIFLTSCQKGGQQFSQKNNHTTLPPQSESISPVYAVKVSNDLIQHLSFPIQLSDDYQLSEINRVGYISGEKIFKSTYYIQVFQLCYQNKKDRICANIQTLSHQKGIILKEFPNKETLDFKKKVNYNFEVVSQAIKKMENIPFEKRKFIQVNDTNLFFELIMLQYVNLHQFMRDEDGERSRQLYFGRPLPINAFVKINPFPPAQPLVMDLTLSYGYIEFFDYDENLITRTEGLFTDSSALMPMNKTSVSMLINYCIDGIMTDKYQAGYLIGNYSDHCRFYNQNIRVSENYYAEKFKNPSSLKNLIDLSLYLPEISQNDLLREFIRLHELHVKTGKLNAEHFQFMDYLKTEAKKTTLGKIFNKDFEENLIPHMEYWYLGIPKKNQAGSNKDKNL